MLLEHTEKASSLVLGTGDVYAKSWGMSKNQTGENIGGSYLKEAYSRQWGEHVQSIMVRVHSLECPQESPWLYCVHMMWGPFSNGDILLECSAHQTGSLLTLTLRVLHCALVVSLLSDSWILSDLLGGAWALFSPREHTWGKAVTWQALEPQVGLVLSGAMIRMKPWKLPNLIPDTRKRWTTWRSPAQIPEP